MNCKQRVILGIIANILLITLIILVLKTSHFASVKEKFEQGIPKIIHQTAPADKSKWPEIWYKCQQSWKDKFPDYEYKMWTDEDLDEFMKTNYPEDYDMYRGYEKNIYRIDAARYYILNTYGGIYADMDFECVHNFQSYLVPDKVSIAKSVHQGEMFQNALMISPVGHPLWEEIIFPDLRLNKDVTRVEDLKKIERFGISDYLVPHKTGPHIIIRAYEVAPDYINPLPAEKFTVITATVDGSDQRFNDYDNPEIYTVHHGTCSWC